MFYICLYTTGSTAVTEPHQPKATSKAAMAATQPQQPKAMRKDATAATQ
jgi:hypothetical protein